jgi:hypothetical protein
MTATADLEVVGLKDALKTLNKLNPTVRRTITKDFKKITQPVVVDAQSKIPQMPLSGFKYNWTTKSGAKLLPWDSRASSKLVKSGVSGKKPKEFRGNIQNASVFYIRWAGAMNTIYDMASKGNLGKSLRTQGEPSRVLWPAYERNKAEVEAQTLELAFDAMRAVDRMMKK